jgi:hypothetical protein
MVMTIKYKLWIAESSITVNVNNKSMINHSYCTRLPADLSLRQEKFYNLGGVPEKRSFV